MNTQIHPDPDRGLLLKGLLFNGDHYVSQVNQDFWWPDHGVVRSECEFMKANAHHRYSPILETCTCGIYSTYDIAIALLYRRERLSGALFLLQPGGETVYYEHGCRSEMAQLVAVVRENFITGSETFDHISKRVVPYSSQRASKYFSLPILQEDLAKASIDIHMMQLSEKSGLDYQPRYYSKQSIRDFVNSMQIGG